MVSVTLPVGAAAVREATSVSQLRHEHASHHHTCTFISAESTRQLIQIMYSLMNDFQSHVFRPSSCSSFVFITDSRRTPCSSAHTHTSFPEVLHFIHSLQINSSTTLFMIPNLCQQPGRPPLTAASPLISAASCLCLPLHVRSLKQWYFLVTSNEFVRF